MKRARHRRGSVVLDKRRKVWNYLYCESGRRRTKLIGTQGDFRTKEAAWAAVENQLHTSLKSNVPTLRTLVAQYRVEKMPERASTRRGYQSWLENYILPRWGNSPVTELRPRPVELWLQSLKLAPKSKLHLRGLLRLLWDYAMWRDDVPSQRNPMELVSIRGAVKRVRRPRSLTAEQFHAVLEALSEDVCVRTLVLIAVSFGLRISEVLGLKWQDVNWLDSQLNIERGVVKQIVDDVKTVESARTMIIADDVLALLKEWKQTTQFSSPGDWIFASPVELGRQPLSYTHVWYRLDEAGQKAGIGHISSHTFRHTYRTWLDSVGTPVGVQQKLMRHADIRTTMNIYGDAVTDDMRRASEKVARIAIPKPLN